MRRANRPVLDEDSRTTVTLKTIEKKTKTDVRALKQGLPPDEARYETYVLEFSCEGITGDFRINDQCGTVINDEPSVTKYRGKEVMYNKLTSFLLAVGLLTMETISTADPEEVEREMLALGGTQYTAHVGKVERFYEINLASLVPVE